MRIRVYVRVYAVGIGRVGRLHEIKWLLVTHRLPSLHTAHTALLNVIAVVMPFKVFKEI